MRAFWRDFWGDGLWFLYVCMFALAVAIVRVVL